MSEHDRTARWRAVRRVLAVRLDNLGDVLMTTPALAAIRASVPRAYLALLASPAGAAVARYVPQIDRVIEFTAPWMKLAERGSEAALGDAEQAVIQRLADERFDAAVIFTVCTQSALPAALLCRLAGIPLRLAHSRENPYALLTDWVPETDRVERGMRHEVARQLALVEHVGWRVTDSRLRMEPHAVDAARVRACLASAGLSAGHPYFVVHPGASAPSRRWPAERFGAVADALARQTGCAAIFTGDADETPVIDTARSAMKTGSISLAGQLGIGELAALIAGSRLLVVNNTGPAHIAAAVGTPVVVLYALTNPQHTPWKTRSRVLFQDVPCRHCLKSICPQGHHDCLRKVEPAAVIEAALDLLRPQEAAA